jgi:high-affinity iron transporter
MAQAPDRLRRMVWKLPAHRFARLLARAGLLVALISASGIPVSGVSGVSAAADRIAPDEVLRLHMLLNLVGEEYRESVVGEESLRAREYAEAQSFLEEATRRWARIGGPTGAGTNIYAVETLLASRATPEAVRGAVERLQLEIAKRTGVAADVFPPEPPSIARGRALFAQECARCHGAAGDGRGPEGLTLDPPPSDFTDQNFMREQTPFDFFHVITAGRRAAGMPAWEDALSLQQRWDAVGYLWTLRAPDLERGAAQYDVACAGCHGVAGGVGPVDLRIVATTARSSDAELMQRWRAGHPGAPGSAVGENVPDDDVFAMVAYVRGLGTADGIPGAAIDRARELLEAAVRAGTEGKAGAADLALDAYLAYEAVEKRVRLAAPGVNRRLEGGFTEVRARLRRGGDEAAVRGVAEGVFHDLESARRALAPARGTVPVFIQAATILLREGFEALIVIAALAAYLVRTGQQALRRSLYLGAVGGVGASLLTAWILVRVVDVGPGAQEVLEGATLLLAAAVLFCVSYWLISQAEAARWQRYIRGRVDAALARGSAMALAGTSFLAVFREGVETVLFYQALLGAADGAGGVVAAGMGAGAVALGVLYFGTTRLGVRIPMRGFFVGTGVLLYGMAVVFAGTGIRELQEADIVRVTPLAAWPTVDWLGMAPNLEVATAQGLLLLAAVVALVVRLRSGVAQPETRGEAAPGERRPAA